MNIKCDRTCRKACKTRFEASFEVLKDEKTGQYKGLTTAPDENCYNNYDEEKTKRPSYKDGTEDEGNCRRKLDQAESFPVIFLVKCITR